MGGELRELKSGGFDFSIYLRKGQYKKVPYNPFLPFMGKGARRADRGGN